MNSAKRLRKTLNAVAIRLVCLIPAAHPVRARAEYAYHWLCFAYRHRRPPRRSPLGFNDYLFCVKTDGTLDHPLRRQVTDKPEGKRYIECRLGPGWTVDTIAILGTHDEVDRFAPASFPIVLKPTHSSGRIVVAQSAQDYVAATRLLHSWLEHDYFRQTMEQNYRSLARRIIVEPYVDRSLSLEGSIHCRDGRVRIVSVIDRFDAGKRRSSLDRNWRALDVALGFPYVPLQVDRPAYLDQMIEMSEILGAPFPYLRIDFYASENRFVFGELTNLPGGGLARFSSRDGERRFNAALFG